MKIVLDSGGRTCSLYILRIFLRISILRHGANFQTLGICYNFNDLHNKYAFNPNQFMVGECIRYEVPREEIRCNE